MSFEDWDLFAVVRSCNSSLSAATSNTTSTGGGHEDDGGNCKQQQDFPLPPPPPPSPLFTHIHGHRDREMASSSSSSSCNELQESCKPFLPVITTTTWFSPPPPLKVSSSAPNVLMKQEQGLLLESQDQKPSLGARVFPPSTSSSPSLFAFRGQAEALLQQPQSSQAPPRSKKRKNQQKKTVCHVRQENLSSDMWAWRKYGQKPIKGSPHPRNYYRCSSSKGCLARKQVEKSSFDPDFFIVTYNGEHTHPRPTHRNSLAGSTRNKSQHVNPIPQPESSGQTVSRSDTAVTEENHLSPTTPLKENEDVKGTNGDEDIISQEVNMEDEEEEEDGVGEDEDDDVDDLLIPNYAVRDRDDMFIAENFPSWSAGSAGDGGR